MKRLLTVLGAIQLVATPAMTVISCDSNKNYETFKGWIDNKDSFVLYIGADDCEHCNDLDKALNDLTDGNKHGTDIMRDGLAKIAADWNKAGNGEDQYIGADEVKSIDFHSFKDDKYDGIWNNSKWMKNIRDWTVDQYYDLFVSYDPNFVDDNTYYTEDVVKDAIKTMIVGNGTPIFVVVRNGKLVTVDNGFSGTNSLDPVYTLVNDTLKADFENTLITDTINKIKAAVNSDSVTTNKFNYDNVNLYQYLK
jgi:hypothetical protein